MCHVSYVDCNISPVTWNMSSVTWPSLYAALAAMKSYERFDDVAVGGLVIDRYFYAEN